MQAILAVGAALTAAAMTAVRERDVIEMPTRLSIYPSSSFYKGEILRKVGVKIDGQIRDKDVVEFDTEAGWIDVQMPGEGGRPMRNADGTFRTMRLTGIVEAYWKGLQPVAPVVVPKIAGAILESAAEAKRARKAAKLMAAAEKGGITKVMISDPTIVIEEKTVQIPKVRKPRAKKVMA